MWTILISFGITSSKAQRAVFQPIKKAAAIPLQNTEHNKN
jgi:antitoxin component of RelBE/YafQ-DinJ toxin-antitoxin module